MPNPIPNLILFRDVSSLNGIPIPLARYPTKSSHWGHFCLPRSKTCDVFFPIPPSSCHVSKSPPPPPWCPLPHLWPGHSTGLSTLVPSQSILHTSTGVGFLQMLSCACRLHVFKLFSGCRGSCNEEQQLPGFQVSLTHPVS